MIAGYFGINPPDFVAATVALAFGLAAASFFPAIVLGIFSKRMNKEGAIIRISAKVEAIEKIDELITSLSLIKGEIAKNTFIKLSTQIK